MARPDGRPRNHAGQRPALPFAPSVKVGRRFRARPTLTSIPARSPRPSCRTRTFTTAALELVQVPVAIAFFNSDGLFTSEFATSEFNTGHPLRGRDPVLRMKCTDRAARPMKTALGGPKPLRRGIDLDRPAIGPPRPFWRPVFPNRCQSRRPPSDTLNGPETRAESSEGRCSLTRRWCQKGPSPTRPAAQAIGQFGPLKNRRSPRKLLLASHARFSQWPEDGGR